ncbi:uncharacterized protein DNG_03880 [Cephalotrichum gorgonifer]|uniref:Uncharacterized protein n=1 Tax=Cephalotrichum gorgonifer TaxID=2041049 RepID=A0AAE8MXF0_9PEZI|nr:uncharacterized protein DNG_03880 [Cephalotrichum gorgonifer]
MLDKSELYLAVRGEPVFWSTVTSQLDSDKPVPVRQVKNIVHCYVKSRKGYAPPKGPLVTNDMTRLVDLWIEIETECQSLPPPEAFQVTFKTEPSQPTNMFQNLVFRPKPWPPVHFSLAEQSMIKHNKFRPLIEGRCIECPSEAMALPSKTSMPAVVRAFITTVALENYHPSRSCRLALISMGNFIKDGIEFRWSRSTDCETDTMWTPSSFSIFADAFRVAPEQSSTLEDKLNQGGIEITSPELWATRCPRVGMVLVLRRIEGGAEYVLFDPNTSIEVLRDPYYNANKLTLMQFKCELIGLLQKAMETPLRGGWVGGKPRHFEDGWDSVQICCDWLRTFVSETGPQDPFPTTEEGWNAAGYTRSTI